MLYLQNCFSFSSIALAPTPHVSMFIFLQVQSEKRKLESEVKLLGDRARQQGQENEQLRGEIAFLR